MKTPSVIYISLKHNLLFIISLLQTNNRKQISMTELAVLPKFSRLRPVVQAAYMKTLLRDILITTSITLFGSKISPRSFRFSQIRSVICWRVLHPLVGMFRLIIKAVTSAISSASSTLRFMPPLFHQKGVQVKAKWQRNLITVNFTFWLRRHFLLSILLLMFSCKPRHYCFKLIREKSSLWILLRLGVCSD